MSGEQIPLFPLSAVLLPHGRMPLQIFERRYLDLVRDCMKAGSGFGVAGGDPVTQLRWLQHLGIGAPAQDPRADLEHTRDTGAPHQRAVVDQRRPGHPLAARQPHRRPRAAQHSAGLCHEVH